MKALKISHINKARFAIIENLLVKNSDNAHLLDYLFVEGKDEMFAGPENIRDESRHLSGGEQILIEVACAIWFNDENFANMFEICRRLDGKNFLAVMQAFVEFRKL